VCPIAQVKTYQTQKRHQGLDGVEVVPRLIFPLADDRILVEVVPPLILVRPNGRCEIHLLSSCIFPQVDSQSDCGGAQFLSSFSPLAALAVIN
jgi:hypothetical protein